MDNQQSKKQIFKDRKRTNILNAPEQKTILYLVERIPNFITPNHLTIIGNMGSLMVLCSFILGKEIDPNYLLLGVLGLAINWFGDSLDGRIAYFRKIPRKWYGFSLDIIMDWISTIMICLGFYIYADSNFKIVGLFVLAMYGWAMIISQLRYKITDKYTIDAGIAGPTEIRVIIALILILETIFDDTMQVAVVFITLVLFIINFKDTQHLLKLGDERDNLEKAKKSAE